MGMIYVPYNPNTDVWNSIGKLAGGLMRDNYDQRGGEKILGRVQDEAMYNDNNSAIRALEERNSLKNQYANATTDTARNSFRDMGLKNDGVLSKYGITGIGADSTPEDILARIDRLRGVNSGLDLKYQDKRFAGMPKLGTGYRQPGQW